MHGDPGHGPGAAGPGRGRDPRGLDERHGVVWMAPRRPAAGRFDFPEWDDPAFVNGMSQVVRTAAGAALLVDNFLDAAHFPFVHARLLSECRRRPG